MRPLLFMTALFLSACFFDSSGLVENPYVEQMCSDDLDNDEDGFTDCEEQDCCGDEHCAASPVCQELDQPDE